MKIGYACKTVGVKGAELRGCVMKYADKETLRRVTAQNLDALERMIDYNAANGIRLFRISSDIIPFGSSPVNSTCWQREFAPRFAVLAQKIASAGMRVSMHPGQYTVLNSPDPDVAGRAVKDLEYHTSLLECLGADTSHKIVLHIGGLYGDKKAAASRFIQRCRELDENIRRRLVLENDERCFHIGDVLEIAGHLRLPVVYDNLHNRLNPFGPAKDDAHWVAACSSTWGKGDGVQKIHYAQQEPGKRPGAHSATIRAGEFLGFVRSLGALRPDIMLEVKDKNLSAVKCLVCLDQTGASQALPREWERYALAVHEHDEEVYRQIQALLRHKDPQPELFYTLVEQALRRPVSTQSAERAALAAFHTLQHLVTDKETQKFTVSLQRFQKGETSAAPVKTLLYKLAGRYERQDLLQSYYYVM